jgi:hypothetical protein
VPLRCIGAGDAAVVGGGDVVVVAFAVVFDFAVDPAAAAVVVVADDVLWVDLDEQAANDAAAKTASTATGLRR